MNQYLVAIHYIQLLQAELNILNHDARLLFDLKIDPNLAKRELADLKVSLSKLSDKNLYIEGTIWYQPSLFAIIDQNLGVIDDWLKELDDFFEFSYGTTVYSVLKENDAVFPSTDTRPTSVKRGPPRTTLSAKVKISGTASPAGWLCVSPYL